MGREQEKPPAEQRPRLEVLIEAGREVGPSLFFSLLIITVSFLPVFALQDQEGRLFKPLAYTKTFSMFFAAVLSITVTPLLMILLIRGRIPPEARNPINRFLIWIYPPLARLVLKLRYVMIGIALLAVAAIVPIYSRLGSEFMPPLWEETILYMPATLPGASVRHSTYPEWVSIRRPRRRGSTPDLRPSAGRCVGDSLVVAGRVRKNRPQAATKARKKNVTLGVTYTPLAGSLLL
jgi:Cu/Ag efflux pump CusA